LTLSNDKAEASDIEAGLLEVEDAFTTLEDASSRQDGAFSELEAAPPEQADARARIEAAAAK
jgi:hypothetical protein